MRPHLKALSLFLFALSALPASSFALPAPMSEQELTEKSDLVAVVRVLSVTNTGAAKDEKTGEELSSYLAKLRLLEVKKGDAKAGDEVLVTWRAIPKGMLGPWAVYYYPGEVVLTHLAKKSGASFGSTWWNAKGDDIKPPPSTELPASLGETISAPQEPPDKRPL